MVEPLDFSEWAQNIFFFFLSIAQNILLMYFPFFQRLGEKSNLSESFFKHNQCLKINRNKKVRFKYLPDCST